MFVTGADWGLEATKEMRDRLIRCLTSNTWSRDRRHVWSKQLWAELAQGLQPSSTLDSTCCGTLAIVCAGFPESAAKTLSTITAGGDSLILVIFEGNVHRGGVVYCTG